VIQAVNSFPFFEERLADVKEAFFEGLAGLTLPTFNNLVVLDLIDEA